MLAIMDESSCNDNQEETTLTCAQ